MIASTHYTLDFTSAKGKLLEDETGFLDFIGGQIKQAGLTQLGVTSHTFNTGGFTVAICLAESHLCIHTWPEKQTAAFDIFVSNHNEENRNKVDMLVARVKDHFSAGIIREQYIQRF